MPKIIPQKEKKKKKKATERGNNEWLKRMNFLLLFENRWDFSLTYWLKFEFLG